MSLVWMGWMACTLGSVHQLEWATSEDSVYLIDVSWTQERDRDAHVEVEIDGTWVASPVVTGEAGPRQITLAGLPTASSLAWRVVVGGVAKRGPTPIETHAPPTGLARVTAGPQAPAFS